MTAPPVSPELADAALASPALTRARALAGWIGSGRTLTARGVLRPVDAAQACRDLGIAMRGARLRSALDVPELMLDWLVALEAGFLEIDARRVWASPAWAAGAAADPERVLTSWGSAAVAVIDLDLRPCPGCLTVLYELHAAGGPLTMDEIAAAVAAVIGPADLDGEPCPDCGGVHDSELSDLLDIEADEDPAGHAADTVTRLADFGAADAADGTIFLTSLGTMLAELVLHLHAPAATAPAAAVVDALGELPPEVAWHVCGPWLAARTVTGAARELLSFAESAPAASRVVALSLARELGAGAAAAWREWESRPGFGAYAREWLREQGEAPPQDPADEAWLAVEALCLLLGRLDATMPPLLAQQVLAEQAGDLAEAVLDSGHPRAAELAALLGGQLAGPADRDGQLTGHAARDGRLPGHADRDGQLAYQLKITLRGVSKPPVWRRVLVRGDATLRELHGVIQQAMGWADCHLYAFTADGQEFSSCDPELGHADDRRVRLSHFIAGPGDRLRYTYDFGDGWEHDIVAEECGVAAPGQGYPACVAGRGACPPEDCGGTPGYARLKEVLDDPSDADHGDMLDWMGLGSAADFDPAAFSVAEAGGRVRQLAQAPGAPVSDLAQAPGRPGER